MRDLTVREVAALKKPGRHRVSRNLYAQVEPAARGGLARCWILRYGKDGSTHEMGLGPLDLVTLAEAREKVHAARRLLLEGRDPLQERRAAQRQGRLEATKAITFQICAERYIAAHTAGWRNAKHGQQWQNTLSQYVYPTLGPLPVAAIDTALVMQVLEPIWQSKPETASRVRGRIESILDWARARSYRTGENPSRWRGHLDQLLPARRKVATVKPMEALPYRDVQAFMEALREQEGIAARALEFTILTAARTGQARYARWSEFDLRERLWTVPGSRMKATKEHRVPLSDRAMAILHALPREEGSDFLFPGHRAGKPIGEQAMLLVLRPLTRFGITTHGFRSSFADWGAETTAYPAEVRDMALGHAVADQVEAAYRRGDLFEKRRRLLEDWARYCASPARGEGEVVPLRGAAG